jgi:hypothetical protein
MSNRKKLLAGKRALYIVTLDWFYLGMKQILG